MDGTIGRKLFVGGLNVSTTEDSLRSHFGMIGEVLETTLMIDRVTGRSRCFGFITMRDPNLVIAIINSEQFIDGKRVDCKDAVPRDNNTPQFQAPENHFRTKKVFVGGLPPDITDDEFRSFFR
jgi:RNA recognition motif-containing protein